MSDVAIRIDGLARFSRNLKQLDSSLPKVLRVALNEAAEDLVGEIRAEFPKRTGRAAASVRAASTRTAVRIREGGPKAPYAPWLDFGGRVGRRKRTVRPFLKEGRYLYEVYFRHRDSGRIQRTLEHSLLRVAHQAGIEVDR